jgi:hypothetical protein
MVDNTKVSGVSTKCMARESLLGLLVKFMRANTMRMKKAVQES